MARRVNQLLLSVLIGGALLGGSMPIIHAAEAPAAQTTVKTLAMLDFSELQLDGAAALLLTFNTPFYSRQDFSQRLHTHQ